MSWCIWLTSTNLPIRQTQTLFAKATAASFGLFSIFFLTHLDYKCSTQNVISDDISHVDMFPSVIWKRTKCMCECWLNIIGQFWQRKKFVNWGRKELLRGFADSPSLSPGEWLRAPIQRVKELVLTLLSPSKMPLKNGNTDPLATFAIL